MAAQAALMRAMQTVRMQWSAVPAWFCLVPTAFSVLLRGRLAATLSSTARRRLLAALPSQSGVDALLCYLCWGQTLSLASAHVPSTLSEAFTHA
jgi:hypothetical protein